MKTEFTIVVCASGGGGNFQALIDSQATIGYRISLLIVDRECGAIGRAVENGIPVRKCEEEKRMDRIIPENTNLIVLAGFLPIVDRGMCARWKNRIINTHPSLLPRYGGKGMYGVKVQEAVMAAKEKYAGCTVHFVDDTIDGGRIILQKSVEVDYNETPWELGGRIFKEENKLLVEAIRIIMSGRRMNTGKEHARCSNGKNLG